MPTQQNTYNSRITDEALEKRFRDTFRSQGGAELVDDLYASGVIIPVVDFTQAAEGSQLPQNLQTAWDFSTNHNELVGSGNVTLIQNAGFWQVDLTAFMSFGSQKFIKIYLTDGLTNRTIWQLGGTTTALERVFTADDKFVVFIRAGEDLILQQDSTTAVTNVWYRQIATVNGDLVNPSGFTSS